jgi:6-pyruvoyltetrahydropterin/6-carboxytetrahydropterin synthase
MIQLTREVRLSLSATPGPVPPAPGNTWAGFPTSPALAPFVCIRVTLLGEPDPASGYLCDIKAIDDQILTAIHRLGPEASTLTEPDFLHRLWHALPAAFVPGATLTELQLLPSPFCRFTVHREAPHMIQYTEQFEFSASHRLHCPDWSAEQNQTIFGKCNNPNGHGHNYVIEVTVRQPPEPWDFAHRLHLQRAVKETVLDRFDHKHLNLDTPEFRDLNPTIENITRVIWDLVRQPVQPLELVEVKVLETAKTWAVYRGEMAG